MDSAFTYIQANKIHETKDYPYVAKDQACKTSSTQGLQWTLSAFVDVPGCTELTNALDQRPISVAVDASVWSSYRSGILSNCGLNVNHGVLLIGSSDQYWRVKNSWGAAWGESGFIRLAKGNTCAICQYPSYPTL
jgi:C1A family cysteine protease